MEDRGSDVVAVGEALARVQADERRLRDEALAREVAQTERLTDALRANTAPER